MKTINYDSIVEEVAKLCISANNNLPSDTMSALQKNRDTENSVLGKSILEQCIINANIAHNDNTPICQDTGLSVFFIKLGTDVYIEGKSGMIYDAINDGVKKGYTDGYLRKSVLTDPIYDRQNTGDNTPAIIHLELVKGTSVEITIAPKGGGAENMSAISMLPPAAGEAGVLNFIVETAIKGGGNPCPPIVVGVGIGGNFERCAFLAKRALLRPIGSSNCDERYAKLENTALALINKSGVGPQGLGGNTTALAVNIEFEPCHLASLPVAVNINCHVHRHEKIIL